MRGLSHIDKGNPHQGTEKPNVMGVHIFHGGSHMGDIAPACPLT